MPALTRTFVAATALALLAAGTASAERLTLCNRGDQAKLYSTVQIGLYGSLLPSWIGSGWYTLDPGTCEEVSAYLGRTYVFFHMLSRPAPGGKATIDHYPVADIRSLPTHPPGSYGVETFLCVTGDRFLRVLDTLPEHADCPAGYGQRLFNLLVIVDDSELTLNLN